MFCLSGCLFNFMYVGKSVLSVVKPKFFPVSDYSNALVSYYLRTESSVANDVDHLPIYPLITVLSCLVILCFLTLCFELMIFLESFFPKVTNQLFHLYFFKSKLFDLLKIHHPVLPLSLRFLGFLILM